jgi:hypothetical protein
VALTVAGGAGFFYLLLTRQLWQGRTWRRLRPVSGALIFLVIAAPWHVAATLANPPYLDFTLHSEPGRYRGFFWFYFINEHLLRFLNLRYPRDYNTVPRLQFWLLHLVWLFPWSGLFPAAARLGFKPVDRGGRARLLCLCWAGFLLVFLSFSTTQEYYSMPLYPALALLLGCALAEGGRLAGLGVKLAGGVAAAAALTAVYLLGRVWNAPTPGDISTALTSHPEVYTLSLGHMHDLTLEALAYLRAPLAVAAVALLTGAAGSLVLGPAGARAALALMMVIFLHAARLALVRFDPYLSSRPLAEALKRAPPGKLVVDNQYYVFSSVFFYTNRDALLLNGRVTNLEYGSYAPGAPQVFIDDADFERRWSTEQRYYLLAGDSALPRLEKLAGRERLRRIAWAGGKALYTNLP